jgi:hypothetical protein
MEKIEILVIGKNPEIMKIILRLVNSKPEWNGSTAFSVAEAIEKGNSTHFNVVLLGAGLDEQEVTDVREHFTVPVIQHYGGGSGLLYAEIYRALSI